jgi:gliding motility-associated-like protein
MPKLRSNYNLKFSIFIVVGLLFPQILAGQCINTFPYNEDFETGNGNWVVGGLNADWTWGNPTKSVISQAASGNNCWIVGGLTNSTYGASQRSFVESPCFDFSNVQNPFISFKIVWDTERNFDGGNLQYTINNGVSWINVGSYFDPVDCRNNGWYNNNSSSSFLSGLANPAQGWSGNTQNTSGSCLGGGGTGQWLDASHCMAQLYGQPNVKFRFTFCSGASCNDFDGIAFDKIYIGEAPAPSLNFTSTCNGNQQVILTANKVGCPGPLTWDFGDTNSAVGDSVVHTYDNPGSYLINVQGSHVCSGTVVSQRTITFPEVVITTTPVSCIGNADGAASAQVNFVINPLLVWNTNPVQTTNLISNLTVGSYSLNVSGPVFTCPVTQDFEIDYSTQSDFELSFPDFVYICPGQQTLLNPGKFNSYLWMDGSTDSVYDATKAGWYSVEVTNAAGCTKIDSVEVKEGCGNAVWIPSAFTPDGDGINDIFEVKGIDFSSYWLVIYNRWGQKVFEANQPNIGWDGKQDNELAPIGIYAYRFKYKLGSGLSGMRKGNLFLCR